MSYSNRDILTLSQLVAAERGTLAVAHVSGYVDFLRNDGDIRSAKLWSMVLADLYHRSIVNGSTALHVSVK